MVGEADTFFVVGGSQLMIHCTTNPSTNQPFHQHLSSSVEGGSFFLAKATEASSCRPGGHACGAVPGALEEGRHFLSGGVGYEFEMNPCIDIIIYAHCTRNIVLFIGGECLLLIIFGHS